MALIKCYECGQTVSDKAKICIHCGAPIKIDTNVKILVPIVPTKLGVRSAITASVNGKVVFKGGHTAEVISIEIEKPTKVIFKIQRWGDREFSYNIEPGKKYQLVAKVMAGGFGMNLAFNEVDVIDSEH